MQGPGGRTSRNIIYAASVAAFVLAACTVSAEPVCLEPVGERHTVVGVLDGETFAIADGREVRLVGALAPHPQDAATTVSDWPAATEARAALASIIAGKDVGLALVGGGRSGGSGPIRGARRGAIGGRDRHNRVLAQVYVAAPAGGVVWVQGRMIAEGMARAYALDPRQTCVAELVAAEAAARAAGRGLWKRAAYKVHDGGQTEALERLGGTFQVVEGRIVSVGRTTHRVYFNFGRNRRRDFAVSLTRGMTGKRGVTGPNLLAEGGGKAAQDARVRVRGWLQGRSGPLIEIAHPDLIEIVAHNTTSKAPVREPLTPPAIEVRGEAGPPGELRD